VVFIATINPLSTSTYHIVANTSRDAATWACTDTTDNKDNVAFTIESDLVKVGFSSETNRMTAIQTEEGPYPPY
jgi:hypothetical protein